MLTCKMCLGAGEVPAGIMRDPISYDGHREIYQTCPECTGKGWNLRIVEHVRYWWLTRNDRSFDGFIDDEDDIPF